MSDSIHGQPAVQFGPPFRSVYESVSAESIAEIVAQEIGKDCDRIDEPPAPLRRLLCVGLSDNQCTSGSLLVKKGWNSSRRCDS